MHECHEKTLEYLRDGKSFVVATIIRSSGSTPRKIGTRMLVRPGGKIDFTLGGGPFEALAIEDAKQALADGESRIRRYRFLPVGEDATGMTCGGEVEVFLEVHGPPDRLVIYGGGHLAVPIAQLARDTGFRIVVVDDREEFANEKRFHFVDEVVLADGGYAALDFPVEEGDFLVVVTRCHQTDEACLRNILHDDRTPAFVGVVASRRKAKELRKTLLAEGVPADALEAVRSPVGLDIGAETPSEIAVSIVAEMLAVRAGRGGESMSPPAESCAVVERVARTLR